MNYVSELFNNGSDFISTFWEAEIDGFNSSKFRIEEATLPFTKFSTEMLSSGEKYFSSVEYPGEFSLTIREKGDLSIRKEFKEWEESFFKDGMFVSQGANVKIGSSQDKIHRTLTLRLLEHKQTGTSTNVIIDKEIKDNALYSQARRTARNATNLGSALIPDSITRKYSKTGTKPELPTKDKRVLSGRNSTTDERVLRVFTFVNTKLLGFEPISFNYTDGEPLKYSVSFIADYITEETSI